MNAANAEIDKANAYIAGRQQQLKDLETQAII
jgi:hypothetical protein